jgi:hypothetical protein
MPSEADAIFFLTDSGRPTTLDWLILIDKQDELTPLRLGGNLAVNAVLFRLRTYLAVLESSYKYLKCIDLCVLARP